jgi:NitT/TauT family transport system ATP-binding protein
MNGARAGITVRDVTKVFRRRSGDGTGSFRALDGVTLDVGPREFVAVIGPSGCGKTTLLRMIAGLTRPDSGSITVDGRPVSGPGPERAMVFQHAALMPWADVTSNIALGLKLRGIDQTTRLARTRQAIELVGLDGFERALPRELSGGMQQRVGLARALVVDPSYLLMDEPFGSLDEITRRYMQSELLKIWATQEKGAILITHSVDEAIILSDRIVVMSARPGRIVADLRIPLPFPRSHHMEALPEFAAIREEVWTALGGGSIVPQELAAVGDAPTLASGGPG